MISKVEPSLTMKNLNLSSLQTSNELLKLKSALKNLESKKFVIFISNNLLNFILTFQIFFQKIVTHGMTNRLHGEEKKLLENELSTIRNEIKTMKKLINEKEFKSPKPKDFYKTKVKKAGRSLLNNTNIKKMSKNSQRLQPLIFNNSSK